MTPTSRRGLRSAALGSSILAVTLMAPIATHAQPAVALKIDAGHFNVHTAETTYRPFAELATTEGLLVSSHTGSFTSDSLVSVYVLVISNARATASGPLEERGRPAFRADELDAVVNWVRGGGALLLVIDHYPIGGANRELAQRLGLDVLDGRTEDPTLKSEGLQGRVAVASGGTANVTDALVFDRRTNRIRNHPITCGRSSAERVDRVATFGGASMNVPEGGHPLLVFSNAAVDYVGSERTPRTAAGRNQAVAFGLGSGKVSVLGEAAMLFNFAEPSVQNQQFALNLLQWLAGRLDVQERDGCGDRKREY
jgi:hypothetical protein